MSNKGKIVRKSRPSGGKGKATAKSPSRSDLFKFIKENRDIVLDNHVAIQRAAVAVNRTEMFVFGLVKLMKDKGSITLEDLNDCMGLLLNTDDLANYWDADVVEFKANRTSEKGTDVPLDALGELAVKLENDAVAAMEFDEETEETAVDE